MEQYTASSNSSTEQIVVQAGQIQQQVRKQMGPGAWQEHTCWWVCRSGSHLRGLSLVALAEVPCQPVMSSL